MAELHRVPGNLPPRREKIIGRRDELARLQAACRRLPLVTVTGVGGVGKTRLALEAAAGVGDAFRDGVWWVELSGLQDGTLLPHTITETLPLVDQSTRPVLDVLSDYLAGRELLLVLDTCEHLADVCALTVELLLRAAPGLRIVATSRRPLGMLPEELLTLEPLPVPQSDEGPDAETDAVVLLAERTAEVVPGFAVTDANRAELRRLCRRLEGLPLAIELAAARLREWGPQELAVRLEDRFAVLGEDEGVVLDADPPWHQALRTAIGWSHQLCSPAERLLWARLSVFAGDFDAEAASRVCADEHLAEGRICELLTALVEKSIVSWIPTGGGERYRMLDTIREYGAGWLRRLGEEHELGRRHRDHYQKLAHQADAAWMGSDQIAWYERMVAEHDNLRAALDFCLTEENGHAALEMGGALWFFWFGCGFTREGRHHLDRALARDTAPGPARAKALWACGISCIPLGDLETSIRLAGALREAAAEDTDESALSAAAYIEGASLTLSGRSAQGGEVLDAVPHARPDGGEYEAAWFLIRGSRAFAHLQLGQFAEVTAVTDELFAECGRRGEIWVRAWGDYVRALAALGLGRAGEAAVHARAALDGKHRLHDSIGIALTIDTLASAAVAAGGGERAARLHGIAEQVWHTLGTPQMGTPEFVAARQACEEEARRLIGDDAYDTAFRTGYTTDTDTGVAYALAASEAGSEHCA